MPRNSSRYALVTRLGDVLREYGITQLRLAQELDVDPQRINAYARGRSLPTLGSTLAICGVLSMMTGRVFEVGDLWELREWAPRVPR